MSNSERSDIKIVVDDLSGPDIAELLSAHLEFAHTNSPAGSVHALDLDALKRQGITFWSAWDGPQLVGCIALKELDSGHGEIKSMHTLKTARCGGIARRLVEHGQRPGRDPTTD
ncbi:MAG: GNAT family N-acetyltransferase [Hyphomicrobiaceae bacterium]